METFSRRKVVKCNTAENKSRGHALGSVGRQREIYRRIYIYIFYGENRLIAKAFRELQTLSWNPGHKRPYVLRTVAALRRFLAVFYDRSCVIATVDRPFSNPEITVLTLRTPLSAYPFAIVCLCLDLTTNYPERLWIGYLYQIAWRYVCFD